MKRACCALLLILALACGGGGSDPVEPPPPKSPPKVTSGTFDVTAVMTINGCEQSTVWDGAYDVVIDSLSFSMGLWTGSWNPKTLGAMGESVKDKTTTRSCTATRYSAVYLTFSTPDKFSGTVQYRLRLGGECGDRTGCTTSWVIRGTRQPEPEP